MRVAILDLGTNTFNLLVSEASDKNRLSVIHTSKEPVKLGKGGIHKGLITEDAMERGFLAIEKLVERSREYSPEKIYAFATSAIRDASNGKKFANEVQKRFNIYIIIIPGEREAEMIYKGVRQSVQLGEKPVLILDIGGGSNEFIIGNKSGIFWKHSFNLGMARMLELFPPSDPITEKEIRELERYFEMELENLYPAVNEFKPLTLIGASGSFETFAALLHYSNPEKYNISLNEPSRIIDLEDYFALHNQLLKTTIEQRAEMQGMEPVRVEMIILATVFVNFVLRKFGVKTLVQSDYALKEGVIAEMLNL